MENSSADGFKLRSLTYSYYFRFQPRFGDYDIYCFASFELITDIPDDAIPIESIIDLDYDLELLTEEEAEVLFDK